MTGVVSTVGVAILPDLIKAIPAQRQAERIEKALLSLKQEFSDLQVRIDDWSDQQYEFVTRMVENILSTADAEKLKLLKLAALNAALNEGAVAMGGALLSRTIRDITAAEAIYLLRNFGKELCIPEHSLTPDEKATVLAQMDKVVLAIVESENDSEIVAGLESLGLLKNGADTYATRNLIWTRTAGKIVALISPPSAATPVETL